MTPTASASSTVRPRRRLRLRQRSRRFACLLLAALLLAPAASRAAEKWTVDDLVLAETAQEWTLSSAVDLAAWVKTGAEKVGEEEVRTANLWLTRLKTAESIELTRGTDLVSRP